MKINELLQGVAGHLRAMQLFYHQLHNTTAGPSFFADHDAFGGFYGDAEKDYDSVVEWAVGAGYDEVAMVENQMCAIHAVLCLSGPEEMEKQLCLLCKLANDHEDGTIGLMQLVGDVVLRSEVRSYKLKQRAST